MRIRSATSADAARILEIYGPFVTDTAVSFETEVPTLEEMRNRIDETTQKFPWLVYEANNQVIGYAYAAPHRSRCAYAWSVEVTVYLDPKFHGQGIGRALYKRLFEVLREQGAVNAFAGITLPNEASVGFHEAMGFKKIGQFKDIGFKLGKWWDTGWWQLQIQKPEVPRVLQTPRQIKKQLE